MVNSVPKLERDDRSLGGAKLFAGREFENQIS